MKQLKKNGCWCQSCGAAFLGCRKDRVLLMPFGAFRSTGWFNQEWDRIEEGDNWSNYCHYVSHRLNNVGWLLPLLSLLIQSEYIEMYVNECITWIGTSDILMINTPECEYTWVNTLWQKREEREREEKRGEKREVCSTERKRGSWYSHFMYSPGEPRVLWLRLP